MLREGQGWDLFGVQLTVKTLTHTVREGEGLDRFWVQLAVQILAHTVREGEGWDRFWYTSLLRHLDTLQEERDGTGFGTPYSQDSYIHSKTRRRMGPIWVHFTVQPLTHTVREGEGWDWFGYTSLSSHLHTL